MRDSAMGASDGSLHASLNQPQQCNSRRWATVFDMSTVFSVSRFVTAGSRKSRTTGCARQTRGK